ncbi:MAG: phosphatase [Actinomycetota bacterium]|nr:phosphatase [Actinomycetota bacterium]
MPSDYFVQARERLVANGVVGHHRSHSRKNNLYKIRALVDGDEDASFGLSGFDKYSESEVLSFLAELTGCSSDIACVEGEDTLDPDLTVAAVIQAARRLKEEADRGATLLAATGHPTGMIEHHLRVVDAYRKVGGKILRLREEEKFRMGRGLGEIRYIGGVGCLATGASLVHTHSAEPMEAMLEAEPWPDIVLGDHGYAGAALERGIPAIAIMDINDPALAVAWAEKRDVIVIPCDDNRPPRLYEPMWRIFQDVLGGRDIEVDGVVGP